MYINVGKKRLKVTKGQAISKAKTNETHYSE